MLEYRQIQTEFTAGKHCRVRLLVRRGTESQSRSISTMAAQTHALLPYSSGRPSARPAERPLQTLPPQGEDTRAEIVSARITEYLQERDLKCSDRNELGTSLFTDFYIVIDDMQKQGRD